MKNLKTSVAAAVMVALSGAAQAALVSLGDGTVKDTNTNLIWLQSWDVNGQATWDTQKNWANNLNFAGSTDWALPSITDYTNLFAAYGDLTLVSEFTNVRSAYYWSGTDAVPEQPGLSGWLFKPSNGLRPAGNPVGEQYAVAVRAGDVTASVPEPETLSLTLLALGAAVVVRRRRSD